LQACLYGRDSQQAGKAGVRFIDENRKTLCIDFAHTPKVPGEMIFDNEDAQDELFQQRRVACVERLDCFEGRH
jgi:hypothetical protein